MTTRKTFAILNPRARALLVALSLAGPTLLASGCNDDTTASETETGTGTETGDGDGDMTGDGDGDPTGDGDGEPDPDPVCGDGEVQGDEECDDGNTDNTDACTNECAAAVCGDDIVQVGEECDNGGDNSDTAACKSDCTAAYCGDGNVGPGEGCDDGNNVNDDECNNSCSLPSCGNGEVDEGEACDDGNNSNLDACLNTCVAASCGDQFVQPGIEECDVGALNNDSAACTSTCQNATCGDGLIDKSEGGEVCDGENLDGDACTDNGFTLGTLACADDCKSFDLAACTNCGDATLQDGEVCDGDAFLNDATCADQQGFVGGTLACTAACELDVGACIAPGCGNGILDVNEVCDGALFPDDGNTCAEVGDFDQGTLTCNADSCTLNVTQCVKDPFCGDGNVDAQLNEECDGDTLPITSCATLDSEAYSSGTLTCTPDTCVYDEGECVPVPVCGNDDKEAGEVCDGTDLNGITTCVELDSDAWASGNVSCLVGCGGYDVSECVPVNPCGNGQIDGDEECDGDNLGVATDCTDVPNTSFDEGSITCNNQCEWNLGMCVTYSCGNDEVEGTEVCDGIDFDGKTCATEAGAGNVGNLACVDSCGTINTDGCTLCGNGVIDGSEECDLTNFDNKECLDYAPGTTGDLSCNNDCTVDFGACE